MERSYHQNFNKQTISYLVKEGKGKVSSIFSGQATTKAAILKFAQKISDLGNLLCAKDKEVFSFRKNVAKTEYF